MTMSIGATDEEVRRVVRDAVTDVLELDPAELDDDADVSEEFEADSLKQLELVANLEKRFGIHYSAADWSVGMTSVTGLVERTLPYLRGSP
jgi:acyl carrier protein